MAHSNESRRDLFASAALSALIQNTLAGPSGTKALEGLALERICHRAFKIADAMLESEKTAP